MLVFALSNLLFDYISFMIYNEEYKIKFYCNSLKQKEPVREHIEAILR